MAKASILILKIAMILVTMGWVSVWLLKPTQLWTRKWKVAEKSASTTVFGYNGLDFAVYSFPLILVAIMGLVYIKLKPDEARNRQGKSSISALSNPLIVNSYIGVLSGTEILAIILFFLFLAWTFYAHISNDFKKMTPNKSFKLNEWQFKLFRMATRSGLLAEACLALLLLPVLRGMTITRLLGTFFIWGEKKHILDEMWKWQKKGRIYLAGEIAFVTALVIWITSLPQVRRRRFEIFYYTHHLYMVFLVFFLFHTGDRHFYMVFPGVFLFGLDKLLRMIQSRTTTCILSAKVLPGKAVELILPKDPMLKYTPTSIIFMKIPIISKFQWHPFSITSSSRVDDSTMSVIIKCEGWWTNSLYNKICAQLNSDANRKQCINVAIEGPYGPPSPNFLRYDSMLLIAGGIGITPFLSMLQDIASIQNSGRNKFPSRIYLNPDQKSSEVKKPSTVTDLFLICSFILSITCSILVSLVMRMKRLKKELKPFSAKQGTKHSAEASTCREEHKIQFTGRPSFQDIFYKYSDDTSGSSVGVFVCGSESMKESVASCCMLNSQDFKKGTAQKRKPFFSFHSLNFTL
ncbi:Ferric reduction oxidase 8 [Heracleum sosnowskyi]|uniref:Ferric reduction oxidase 8 n=1 Tax=Heracleum sosnowskyi TaxID=360622 RepID=A0AAD8H9U6_9APIA|nr:Ferric reduction oxidase 8 [Heracleum sosnowskyi]